MFGGVGPNSRLATGTAAAESSYTIMSLVKLLVLSAKLYPFKPLHLANLVNVANLTLIGGRIIFVSLIP